MELPLDPNRIRDEFPRGVIHGFGTGNRYGLSQRGFETIDRTLLRLYLDAPHCATVIIVEFADYRIRRRPDSFGSIVKRGRRSEKDKSEDDDADGIVGSRSAFKRPE
jgi:hypothetical protein